MGADASHSCALSDISECTIAVVVIQRIAVDSGDVNIWKPVVSKVSHRDAHTVAITSNARTISYVCKGAIVVIVVESVWKRRTILRKGAVACTLCEKNIAITPAMSGQERSSSADRRKCRV